MKLFLRLDDYSELSNGSFDMGIIEALLSVDWKVLAGVVPAAADVDWDVGCVIPLKRLSQNWSVRIADKYSGKTDRIEGAAQKAMRLYRKAFAG